MKKMKQLLAVLVLAAATKVAFAFDLNEAAIKAVNTEFDLLEALFSKTNSFERKAFEADLRGELSLSSKRTLVSYKQVSFVFYYQNTNQWLESYTELASPDALICSSNVVTYTNDNNKSPFSYVRVVDPRVTNTVADVTVLVCVSPLDGNEINPSYYQRTIRFSRLSTNKWELIAHSSESQNSAAKNKSR